LNVMEPVIAFNIIQSIRMMDRVLTTFRVSCIEGIEANEKKSSEDVEQSIGVITAISPHVGYEVASSLAKEAMQTGKPIRQIMLERDILSETAINLILDPFEMTKPGISGELVKNNS